MIHYLQKKLCRYNFIIIRLKTITYTHILEKRFMQQWTTSILSLAKKSAQEIAPQIKESIDTKKKSLKYLNIFFIIVLWLISKLIKSKNIISLKWLQRKRNRSLPRLGIIYIELFMVWNLLRTYIFT